MAITSLKHKKEDKPHVAGIGDPIAAGSSLGVGDDTSVVGLNGVSALSESNAQDTEQRLSSAPPPSMGGTPQKPATGQSGAAVGKPVTVNRAPTTRMGVGPGGPPLGFNEAYSLLNAPSNVGDLQQVGRTFGTMGEEQSAAFRQAAGGPISFGERERRSIDAASTPGAPQTGIDEARDVLFRRYGGPMALGQKTESERGLTEAARTTALGEDVETLSRAFGEGGQRAAVAELSGETQGMGARTAQEAYESGGMTEAQRLSAKMGGQNALYAQQLAESMEFGQAQQSAARGVREQAEDYLSDKEDALWGGISTRAEGQRERQRAGSAALSRYNQTGDLDEVRNMVQTSIFEGRHTPQEAKEAWDGIYDRWTNLATERYGGWVGELVSTIAPLRNAVHYTGQLMQLLTEDDTRRLADMDEFDQIRNEILSAYEPDRAGGSREGTWLAEVMIAANGSGEKATQANRFLDVIRATMGRQRELDVPFAHAMPAHLTEGRDVRQGVTSPDQIAAGNQSERHYFRDHLRYQNPGGVRGSMTGQVNMYGRNMPRNVDISEYLTAPEGQITDYTVMTEEEQNQLNQMYSLRGEDRDKNFYQRMPGAQVDIGVDEAGLGGAFARRDEEVGRILSEDEAFAESERDRVRRFFESGIRDAEHERGAFDWGEGSSAYKRPPLVFRGQDAPVGTDDWAAFGLTNPEDIPEPEVV